MKSKRSKDVQRQAEITGRERAVAFPAKPSLKPSKSVILASNSVSFNWTCLASVLALRLSRSLTLVSSKYLVPRATDIQTERTKHKEW